MQTYMNAAAAADYDDDDDDLILEQPKIKNSDYGCFYIISNGATHKCAPGPMGYSFKQTANQQRERTTNQTKWCMSKFSSICFYWSPKFG